MACGALFLSASRLDNSQFPFLHRSLNTFYSSAMATSVSPCPFLGTWVGEGHALFHAKTAAANVPVKRPVRGPPMMKNVNESKSKSEGIFAPAVVTTRNVIGKKKFSQLRGKAIAFHSQVITKFCKSIGADSKQRKGIILIAKQNGEWLGFLA